MATRNPNTITGALIAWWRAHQRSKADARVDAAVRNVARENAESVYSFELAKHYAAQVAAIDFDSDWWGKAAAKQKLEDARADHQHHIERFSRAMQQLEALGVHPAGSPAHTQE